MEEDAQLAGVMQKLEEYSDGNQGIFETIEKHALKSEKNIRNSVFSSEDVFNILQAWDYSFSQAEELFHNPDQNAQHGEEYWDRKSDRYNVVLDAVLHSEKRDISANLTAMMSSEQTEDSYDGIENFRELIHRSGSPEQEKTVKYIAYRLWLDDRLGKENGIEERSTTHVRLMPLLVEGIKESASNRQLTHYLLERLFEMDEKKVADDILIGEGLSAEARQAFAIECMNVFGVIETIDVIADQAEMNNDLKKLYMALQGEELDQIMKDLSEIYKKIDFENYSLNSEELTQSEVDRLKRVIQQYGKENNKDPKKARVIDVGAGTGRHAIPLFQDGYTIEAFDNEQNHIDKIRANAPELVVYRADWNKMPYEDAEANLEKAPEVFNHEGRDLLHNNTPQKMAIFFDEMYRILTPGGVGVIDIPDIEGEMGEYTEAVAKFKKHLKTLGVDDVRGQYIFDGPDKDHKFNRLALTENQFQAYARLFGFKIMNIEKRELVQGKFNNIYYTIEKIADFKVEDIPPEEFQALITTIGLLDPGLDANKKMAAWGVPLGIPIMYMGVNCPEYIEGMRKAYKNGEGGDIGIELHGREIHFSVTYPRKFLPSRLNQTELSLSELSAGD